MATDNVEIAAAQITSAALRRKVLGNFLREARAHVQPQDWGLPLGARRRTPGLRREEIAQLCSISVTWYTWIEQGRNVSVSPTVCARLAKTLKLSRAERQYLFDLAECTDPEADKAVLKPLPQGLSDCVDHIAAPAYILDRSWNVLTRNTALLDLFAGWPDNSAKPNLLRYIFLDAAARDLVVGWEQRARRVVAEFRADVGVHVDEPEVRALVAELQEQSPVFTQWWGRQMVTEREGGVREFNHPLQGGLVFQQFTFRLAVRTDCKLVMLLPSGEAAVS